ncbi:PREDICTED: A disintegrin and metalloproteinase with thrombospondin motifs 20, partial [Hipposideros armiger]|uniref:A disintegrin and metalloproteinase with thrombospondin motifs 20 n=1 Tax=Hipposideros armiger TaxID=186990 RepID=A0A8B7S6N6_HIPAR
MRVAKWLAGLLYQLSLFITRSWEVHFHPRQEALVRTLASYEVVTPARVNEFGEVFPQSHHFSRRKRSSEALEPTPFRTHYRISAYGQLFQLNLSADAAFLAAGYTEVHLGGPAPGAEERSGVPPDLRHCFYRGQVNAHEDHTAVFSLCGGLMGTFKAHDGEYFLEPIMKADGSEHEDNHNKPHLIYRQELKRDYFLHSHKPCDVSESQIKKTTIPFHNYSNMNEDLNIKKEIVFGYTSKNTSLENERSQLHYRKKRFLSYPRYVEVMVTADAKMVHHHGQNLQHYVLTLMSIVAAIYKDSSIGNLINIVIVKLIIIHNEQEGPVISFNAATTLRNFCLWQQTQNVLDDAHPSHHDTAVLITRYKELLNLFGLAELGTMCEPLRSCSISEENGLSAAFTIAHELGHVYDHETRSFKQCRRLWCTSAEGVHKGCRTQHMPLADGTNCGPGMHCHHGLCVNKEMETRPVDGEWGPWGPYSSCSRTCGGGIKSTTRLCNRPEPRNGGKYCVGRRMKFRSCNTDSCPKGKQDFREKQCSDFDGKHFNINGLSPNQAGCDHVLNSKARRDKCGVCGGDNSSCRTMAGVFNSAHYGYNVVVKIPTGATNIEILQHSYSGRPEDDNYLALSDTHGNFLLNGNFVVSMSKKEINIQGAIFEYSGSNNSIERINSTDRLQEELILQVLCVGNLYNPDVHYSFNIPVEAKSDLFTWNPYGPWQDCTKMCQGFHRRKMTCIRKSDHMVMSDQRCDHLPLPLFVTERCNIDCDLRWHIIGKSECSSHCGQGYRSLDVHCMKYSIHKGQTVPVDDHYCSDQLKPPTREPCHGDCVLTRWHYSEWSQCSRSCGGGERSRDAYCINNFGHRLADRECQELPQVTIENCNEFSCPTWATSEWSECLVTCGKGTKQRQVWCELNDDHLSDGFCNPSAKPESLRPCELHTCASWQVGPWSSCTATCGHGYQMRAVKCVNELLSAVLDDRMCHGVGRPSDRQDCIVTPCPILPKIGATSLPVVPIGKMAQWRHGSWTPCSASCGRGSQARYVSCRDAHDGIADESFCAHLPRPAEIAVCFSPCGEWQTGNWSPCSASCGHGKTTRQVLCIKYHQPINENYCDPEVRPSIEQECNVAACPLTYSNFPSSSEQPNRFPGRNFPLTHKPEDNQNQGVHPSIRGNQWRTGPWGSCSSSCAGGVQRRAVVCQDENGESARHCDAASKPPESKHCDSGPCPRWNYGSWGECTQTCGGGIKSRFVICQFPNGQMSQEQNCEILNKPPSVVQCHVHACPDDVSWHRGPWKSCSASCGKGLKYREVLCIDQVQRKLEEKYCSHLQKPRTHKACRSVRCPSWKANRWKECSVTCGSGRQHRDVYCRLRGVGRVAEEMCDQSTRPYFQRQCWRQDCTQYQWAAGEWLDCSTSCKKKETHRQVRCLDAQNIQVNESFCDPSTRPLSTRKCRNPPCKYIVVTADSSQLHLLVLEGKTFTSCKAIQQQNNITKDGDYYLNVKGRIIKIYCAGMHMENPKEYISLVKGEEDNFSEVYGFRLQNPYECPFNGSRRQDCECKNDYLAAGHTVFSKIRIDLTSMQIK